jgi:multiple sugar transport system substrate-binding protein
MNKLKLTITTLLFCMVLSIGSISAQEQINLKMTVWDLATIPYWQEMVDAYDVVNIMLSGGDTADIITVKDIPGYSAMLTRGQILPLDDYIAASDIDLDLYSGATDELTYEGQLYALPFRSDIWILYYNKAIFDAAGVDYPSNDMTWDEFDAVARQLASGSGVDRIYGAHFHVWRSTVQLATVQDGENTVLADDYSFMLPMYELVTQLQADNIIMDYGELRIGNIHYSGVFKNGQVAMLPMGSWFIATLIQGQKDGEFDFEWGIAAYPHPEGVEAGTTAATLTSLAINANSRNQDAAWDFIQFYTGPEGAEILASTGNLPAIRTPEILGIFAEVEGVPAEATEALQTSTVRLEIPMDSRVGAFELILNEEHDLIMTRSVSPEQGISEMTRRTGQLND